MFPQPHIWQGEQGSPSEPVEDMWAPVQTHLFPPVYDVVNDPGEDNNLMRHSLFSHSWVYAPMAAILQEHAASVGEYPNIAPGASFDGYA